MAAMIRLPPLPTSSRTYLSSFRTCGVGKDAAGNGPEPFVRTLARACVDDDDKRKLFNQGDVKVDDQVLLVFDGHEVELWSRIVWKPKWGLTFSDVKSKVHGKCSVTQKSAMVINAPNCHIVDLSLDGALILDAANGTGHDEASVFEEVMIRGFKINKIEQLVRP